VIPFVRSLVIVSSLGLIVTAFAPQVVAQTLPTATIGYSIGYSGPQIAIANARGLWKPAGVDMKTVKFASGVLAFEALIGGQVDFSTMAELPSVTGSMKNEPFTIIADLSRFHGNRIIANFPITSVADLAGKKVGTVLGSSTNFLLEAALKRAGVKAEIQNVAPSDQVPALSRGDISAVVPFTDAIPVAKKVLGANYHELALPEQSHFVLIASKDMTAKHPEIVRAVLATMLASDKIIKATPAAAQEDVSRALDGAVTVDQLKVLWPDYAFESTLGEQLPDLMTLEGEWITAGGMIKNVPVSKPFFRGFIDSGPLKALAPGRVTLK
jgi:NitT/TauT family transport system substrate-binding protein